MVNYLDWDSNFFNLRIGRVVISSQTEMNELYHQRRELHQVYDLIYVFSRCELIIPIKDLLLVDQKVVYKTNIESLPRQIDENINEYKDDFVTEDLLRLALASGEYSRFKYDKNLPLDAFERLYTCWIEQSVRHAIASEVFCYTVDNIPRGMITLSRNKSQGVIGLVATDFNFRGQGIGNALLQYTKRFCFDKGIKELSVATQFHNTPARRLYEKTGFIVSSCSNVWHWWL